MTFLFDDFEWFKCIIIIMKIIKLVFHPGVILFSWFVFVFFLVVILPAVSFQANQMGLSPSIDTNFSFDPLNIYPILIGYGATGREFYLLQRWTFDAIWPLVYGVPIFLTLKGWQPRFQFSIYAWIIYLPILAVTFDYLENINYSLMVILFPNEYLLLAYLGVSLSFIKWISLGTSLVLVSILSLVVLFKVVFNALKSR